MPVVTAATPTYPPQRLAGAVLYGKGLTCVQSDDGGVEEFEESWASRASSLATRAAKGFEVANVRPRDRRQGGK